MPMTLNEAYIEQKVVLGTELYNITSELLQVIKTNQIDSLGKLMEERERIINDINRLDQIYQTKCSLQQVTSLSLKEDILKLRQLLIKVQNMDKELISQLEILRTARSDDLKQIKQVKKVQSAYYANLKNQGNLLDKQR